MALYVPTSAGMLHSDNDTLVKLLQNGDGMGWPGDPRMYLAIGVMEKKNRSTGKIVDTGRRYEVWRFNEDGTDTIVGHWHLNERDMIIWDLTRMRSESPGHVDTDLAVDLHNDKLEKDIEDKIIDAKGEMLEHALKLNHDITEGRNVFRGMPGTRDEPKVATDAGK